ncbi:MAG: TraR/DksA family transcriptional regulator [Candidatus Cloacimonadota bacterium]|nr:TraR/DksA family transcriptional regulator [Candidatus Cloacimonadota bacterium]
MSAKELPIETLEKYKKLISEEKDETLKLIQNINKSIEHMSEDCNGNNSSDPDNQSDFGSSTDYIERQVYLLEKENDKLEGLNKALRRIFNKSYGICQICGKYIPEARLKIVPFANLCIDCKSKEETRHK